MPDTPSLYLLIVVAIALGFVLGRAERRRRAGKTEQAAMQDYYRGLDFVLREPSDVAVERFIESMPVEEATIDTHLALGAVLRHRGEADKAVRIHQNLIAQAQLSDGARARAEFELARDYFAAGLLGRAESLLVALVSRDEDWQPQALNLLVDIYQRERDWPSAIRVAKRLGRREPAMRRRLAHFHCELAERSLAEGDLREARRVLAAGADADAHCARIHLLSARVEEAAGRPKVVRKQLNRALGDDPSLAVDSASMFERACVALEDHRSWRRFLESNLAFDRDAQLLARLVGIVAQTDPERALQIAERQLAELPTLAGLRLLLSRWRAQTPEVVELLKMLQKYLAGIDTHVAGFRCGDCGFVAQTRMWQCPSCHGWDTAQPQTSTRAQPRAA